VIRLLNIKDVLDKIIAGGKKSNEELIRFNNCVKLLDGADLMNEYNLMGCWEDNEYFNEYEYVLPLDYSNPFWHHDIEKSYWRKK
jgi:hypothetical protein